MFNRHTGLHPRLAFRVPTGRAVIRRGRAVGGIKERKSADQSAREYRRRTPERPCFHHRTAASW